MTRLTGGLALSLMLCCMSTTQAGFVIDDFTEGTTVIAGVLADANAGVIVGEGFSRTVSVTSTNVAGATAVIGGGAITVSASGAGAPSAVSLSYTRATSFSVHDLNINNVLSLNFFNDSISSVADWTLTVTGSSTAFDGTEPGGPITVAIPVASGPSFFDGGDFANGLVASNLNSLTFDFGFTGGSDAAFSSGASGGIAAVPEPTSMALLGLTGLGGIVVARRRQKKTQATA